MSNYFTTDAELTSIANSIRIKGGTSSSLSFPIGFINAVNNLHPMPTLQSSSVTPIESAQTITPSSGYDGFSEINIQGISASYIGTGVTRLNSSLYTPGTTDQTISSCVYINQVQTIQGDSNLLPQNIAENESIFGINGTHTYRYSDPLFVNSKYSESIASIDGLQSIKAGAFYSTSINTATFVSCRQINNYAFAYCSSLSSVSFPLCRRIKYAAFINCISLTSLEFPECSDLEDYAFQNCQNLQYISLPKCSTINNQAFDECSNLSEIYFPICSYIGPYAFTNVKIQSIDLSLCTYIGDYAFSSASLLKTVKLSVVEQIRNRAFTGCTALESFYLYCSSVPSLGTSVFISTPISKSSYLGTFGSIYVLQSLVNEYKAAAEWSKYASRIVGM